MIFFWQGVLAGIIAAILPALIVFAVMVARAPEAR